MREKPFRLLVLSLILCASSATLAPEVWAQRNSSRSSRAEHSSYYVARGTSLPARMEDTIDSKESREGDRIRARVTGGQFRNSTLEGRVTFIKKSGKLKGQTAINVTFDRIYFPNGESQNIRADIAEVYGEKSVKKVDEEGTVKGGSRGSSTAKRTAGGAAVGAIIGAIAGGGKGAAIGAGVGAAAGAGSNVVRSSDRVKIPKGTEISVRVR